MLRKRTLAFILLAGMVLASSSPSSCFGQAQEILEERGSGLQRERPSTSIVEIKKALQPLFDTKDFQEEKPLADFIKQFEKAISKKGKAIQIVIEHDAFPLGHEEFLNIAGEKIVLPPVPSKFVAASAFRLVLSQVGRGNATYWIRRGQLVITSYERITSSHFLKSARVATTGKHRRLIDLLDEFAEETGVSIIVDCRDANQARTQVTAAGGGKLETIVRLLVRSVGLATVVLNNAIYVTSPDNARAFAEIKPTVQLDGYIPVPVHHRIPLTQALEELRYSTIDSKWSGWLIDQKVKRKAHIRVTAKWHNYVQPDEVVRILTDLAGLRYIVIDNVMYVTSPAEAKKLEDASGNQGDSE